MLLELFFRTVLQIKILYLDTSPFSHSTSMASRELREKESLQFTEYTVSRPSSTRGSQQPCIQDSEKAEPQVIAKPARPSSSKGIDEETNIADENVVDFEGPLDTTNPLNWPTWYKWMTVVLVSLVTFIK